MAQLIDIQKVTIDPVELAAKVRIADDAPLMTSEDAEATARVLELAPGLVDHVCLGDSAPRFGNVIDDTELAHLLEHLTVELLAKTGLAGEISSGRTEVDEDDERLFTIRLACPDDVLTVAALSSAEWIIEWAYNGGGEPAPDVDAIVSGLVGLIESLDGKDEEPEEDAAEAEPEAESEAAEEAPLEDVAIEENPAVEAPEEPAAEPEPAPVETFETPVDEAPIDDALFDSEFFDEADAYEPETAPEAEIPAEEPVADDDTTDDADDGWNMDNIPAPRPVR